MFGSIGIVLKGSGFYKTDSRSGAKPAGDGSEAPAQTAGGDAKDSVGTKSSDGTKSSARRLVELVTGSSPGAPSDSGCPNAGRTLRPARAGAVRSR